MSKSKSKEPKASATQVTEQGTVSAVAYVRFARKRPELTALGSCGEGEVRRTDARTAESLVASGQFTSATEGDFAAWNEGRREAKRAAASKEKKAATPGSEPTNQEGSQ